MTIDTLVKRLADSKDPSIQQLLDEFKAGLVQPVLPAPGCESARSLSGTFAVRAATTEAAGIRTAGLAETVARLIAMDADARVLLFHFWGRKRLYSVFVGEHDEQIVGVVLVELTSRSTRT